MPALRRGAARYVIARLARLNLADQQPRDLPGPPFACRDPVLTEILSYQEGNRLDSIDKPYTLFVPRTNKDTESGSVRTTLKATKATTFESAPYVRYHRLANVFHGEAHAQFRELNVLVALIVPCVYSYWRRPDIFPLTSNVAIIMRFVAIFGMLAIGEVFVIITGGRSERGS